MNTVKITKKKQRLFIYIYLFINIFIFLNKNPPPPKKKKKKIIFSGGQNKDKGYPGLKIPKDSQLQFYRGAVLR